MTTTELVNLDDWLRENQPDPKMYAAPAVLSMKARMEAALTLGGLDYWEIVGVAGDHRSRSVLIPNIVLRRVFADEEELSEKGYEEFPFVEVAVLWNFYCFGVAVRSNLPKEKLAGMLSSHAHPSEYVDGLTALEVLRELKGWEGAPAFETGWMDLPNVLYLVEHWLTTARDDSESR